MCDVKFFICRKCGNLVGLIKDSGAPLVCCGEEMEYLNPNVTDGANEKHLPVVSVDGDTVTVKVGSVPHPMVEAHYIQWVYLQTDKGGHRKCLNPGDEPVATFKLSGETPIAAYEYCNLHGLWKTEI